MLLNIVLACFAAAFLLFAMLMWKIAPVIFMLMRAQVTSAKTWKELLDKVEAMDGKLDELESKDLRIMRERLERLQNLQPKPAATTRTRRKVTA